MPDVHTGQRVDHGLDYGNRTRHGFSLLQGDIGPVHLLAYNHLDIACIATPVVKGEQGKTLMRL